MTDDSCKVCRTLEAHGGGWMEDALLAHWRGDDGNRLGYRRLAHWLNVRVLEREMERAGMPTAGDEAASKYDRLTGDDEAIARGVHEVLQAGGLPMADLERSFVSYGVVRTHLLDCLDAERPPEPTTSWEPETVSVAADQATTRTAAAVRAQYNKGELRAGGLPTVSVSISLTCPTCGTTTAATTALEDGAVCECPSEQSN